MEIRYYNGAKDITDDWYASLDATCAYVRDDDSDLAGFVPDGDQWRVKWIHDSAADVVSIDDLYDSMPEALIALNDVLENDCT